MRPVSSCRPLRPVLCSAVAFVCLFAHAAGAVPNPVAPNTADCGVMRFDGQYYLMGVGTSGHVLVSDDLIHWGAPIHVFSMNNDWTQGPSAEDRRIHACDLSLRNGIFHLYWSVNYHELRQIGHAVAERPLGPYREPVTTEPLDGRIDPQIFMDEDGSIFFYTVNFNDGNVVWGQPMKDPWTLTGEPVQLLSALKGTWELRDHKVNEAPWVTRYRDRYYLLYNANHTAQRYGHYAIGAAESDTPLGFRNDSKYPFPILTDSRERVGGKPLVKNCGQANLVRGLNGFEWWLVYFAIYGENPARAQAIDRVFFHGPELAVDDPTVASTPGFHPGPAAPTFCDRFQKAEFNESWVLSDTEWHLAKGKAVHNGADGAWAVVKQPKGTHYLVETSLHLAEGSTQQAGLIAWRGSDGDEVRVGLDKAAKTGFWDDGKEGERERKTFALPEDFNWAGWHTFRLEKNAGHFKLWFDDILHTFDAAYGEEALPGSPGLFAHGGKAAFGWFNYTRGWDEWGAGIRGWERALPADWPETERDWPVHQFKGDLLSSYEFAVQMRPQASEKSSGHAGLYAVYVDPGTYLRVSANPTFTEVTLTGKREGKLVEPVRAAIPQDVQRRYPPEQTGHNLRVVKRPGEVLVFVDGREVLSYPGQWPKSRVGLFAMTSRGFTHITCFERGGE